MGVIDGWKGDVFAGWKEKGDIYGNTHHLSPKFLGNFLILTHFGYIVLRFFSFIEKTPFC